MSRLAHKLRRTQKLNTAYTLSNVSYVSDTRPSPGTGTYWGLAFKPDGTKALISAGVSGSQYLREYTLSTAWSTSTMSLDREVNISTNVSFSSGIDFNVDGTKLFISHGNFDILTSYDLSTAYSIVSLSNFDSGDAINDPTSIHYVEISGVPNIFHIDSSQNVNRITVTGDDPDNVTFISSFSLNETTARGIALSEDGLVMLISDNATDTIYQYNISTPFDITTATYSGLSLDVSTYSTSPVDVTFGDNGKKLFVSTFRNVLEFDLI